MLAAIGCRQQPQAGPVDLAKSPWFDPQVQIESLSDADARIRAASAINLGNLGVQAEAALPKLDQLAASDKADIVRKNAGEAASKIRAAMGGGASAN
ncbi:MAG: HEAT repeat domain-containing protein [Pirellulales bacterium]|nr:HEAT repeat domain-containing protein [Pirellulales bacterium]